MTELEQLECTARASPSFAMSVSALHDLT